MFKNYFKTMLRNMKHNKLHTSINVIGMAVAFTCSIVIFLTVYFMFSFDNFHVNRDRIFNAYNFSKGPDGDEIGTSMPYPVQPAVLSENIGIEKATLIRNVGNGVLYNDAEKELGIKLVDNDFFSIFTFPVINGNHQNPLGNLDDVVISEYAARIIFDKESPIGKQIKVKINNVWKQLTVSAVVKDFPINSSFKFDVLARTELNDSYPQEKNKWDNQHSELFVMIAANTTKANVESRLRQVTKKYTPQDVESRKKDGFRPDENGDYASLRLFPLTEMHFNPKFSGGGGMNKSGLYIILLIGVMILLIACFNFVNLNIGLSFNRSKEMGIRKCLGAGKRQVWLQVFGESFFVCLLAMIIGVIGAAVVLKLMQQYNATPMKLSMLFSPVFIAILFAVLFAVAFITGGYPSSIISKLKTTEILKGKFSLRKSGLLRNGLVVAQFVIACVLICATIIIYQQFNYLRNASLGYETSSLVSVPIRDGSKSRYIINQLRMQLGNQSSIVSVSGTGANLGVGKDGSTSKSAMGFDYNGGTVRTTLLSADYNILQTIGIKPLEGRDFSTSYVTDSSNAVIISESLAKQLNKKDILGTGFSTDSAGAKLNVIGIIPDFHLYSMHEKADALMITLDPKQSLAYALVKIKTTNPAATMELIKNTYAKLEPGVLFKGTFVDENIERWYSAEKEMGRMFTVAAIIAIILSCMGLFGIALIAIRQRVKEIGVRKVLGASASGIAVMVTRDFIKPVVLAMAIAIPIAWWAMSQWLQDFVYRIKISWMVFVIAAASAIFIAVLTVSYNAIKAALANPVKSLRSE
jgi:ABC-type antimicrobial peptide transport system permease subunit